MGVVKIFLFVSFLGIFIVSSFADLGNQDIGRRLSSRNPQERVEGLWELQDNNDRGFYTKLIEIVLFDKDPTVREVGMNVLRYIQSMDPEMQRKIVRLATDEGVSETIRIAAQTILVRSIFIHGSIQEELYRVATSRAFSPDIRKAVWHILANKGNIVYKNTARRSMRFYLECRLAFRASFGFL